MGPSTDRHTPRHRAERRRGPDLAALRRRTARAVVGRDLYADDLVLRDEAGTDGAAALPLAQPATA